MSDTLTLGQQVHEYLKKLKIESPAIVLGMPNIGILEESFKEAFTELGFDLQDNSLANTPHRVAKMYVTELFAGCNYSNFPSISTFDVGHDGDNPIIVKNITLYSMCEHHLLPIIGKAHVAYIPNKKVIGLSKINRIVEFFARRPQVQERLSVQIAAALSFILNTDDIAVILDAEHLCVKLRGVEDGCSATVTSVMKGRFFGNPALRQELLALIKG